MAYQVRDQMISEQQNNKQASDHQDIGDIAALLAMSMKGDPMTMLGLGIGRWLRNYLQRGRFREQEEKLNGTQGVNKMERGTIPNQWKAEAPSMSGPQGKTGNGPGAAAPGLPAEIAALGSSGQAPVEIARGLLGTGFGAPQSYTFNAGNLVDSVGYKRPGIEDILRGMT